MENVNQKVNVKKNKMSTVTVGFDDLLLIKTEKKEIPEELQPHENVEVTYKCSECQRFTSKCREKMIRHIRKMHRGEKPYQCYMCDYSTSNSVLYQEHVNIHQGIKPYKCKHCGYSSVSKKYLKKHEDKHIICECGHIAKNKKTLSIHKYRECLKKTSGNPENEEKTRIKPDNKCSACSRWFANTLVFKNHMKNKIRCKICKLFFCSGKIGLHMKKVHDLEKDGLCNFECNECGWSSRSNKKKILLHLIHHPNQTVDENVLDVSVLREYGIYKK